MTAISFLQLTYYLLKQLLRRLLGLRTGLATFEANYFPEDRLLPLTPPERAQLPTFSRCIACGACDAYVHGEKGRLVYPGPSALPLSLIRSLPDIEALGSDLRALEGLDWDALERVCPTRVPFRRLYDFAVSRARSGRSA